MKKFLIIFLFLGLSLSASAQTKARKPAKKTAKPAPVVNQAPASENAETTPTSAPHKKNSRDETEPANDTKEPQKKNQLPKNSADSGKSAPKYNYYYEFAQRDFLVRHVVIEHDENGKGTISFEKKDFDEPAIDPLQLSSASLEKIKTLFQALNFVESTETYQSAERNYAHLGTMKIRRKIGDKERLVEFNWTENKDAKALADEYRKISNQYVWQFDITVARENQPLEAPSLMDALDGYIKRNEISDPPQMLPLLKELSNDERIPLMARNKAAKLIKNIEKK